MRKITFLVLLLPILHACSQDPLTGKEMEITFQSTVLGSNVANPIPFSRLHLFAIDRENTIVRQETYTSHELQGNTLKVHLPLGRYRLAFVANSPQEGDSTFNTGCPLEKVSIPVSRKENGEREANDILTALQSISISGSKDTNPIVRLTRRVGMLHVTLEEIPEEARELTLEASLVPSSIHFAGTQTDTPGTIIKKMTRQENRQAFVKFLTYPVKKGEISLAINYQTNQATRRKVLDFHEAIDTNEIVHLKAYFPELPESGEQGSGSDLLENGDFEYWSNPLQEPDSWKFYKDGKDSSIMKIVGTPVYSGNQSVLLSGKTYLYQDIPVTPNKRYEIKMHINAPSATFSWKYYCYWRKTTSTALPSEYNKPIQASSYQKQTIGWINVFQGKTFLAPEQATRLRVEIRTYGKEIKPGECVYIDDFSVKLVE